jgi:hypothetical protein
MTMETKREMMTTEEKKETSDRLLFIQSLSASVTLFNSDA